MEMAYRERWKAEIAAMRALAGFAMKATPAIFEGRGLLERR
jgi:hypothetical protein